MKRISPKVLLLLAVLLSIICAGLVYSYLSGADKKKAAETAPVVVSTMDIAVGTELKAEMLKVVLMPKDLIQAEAVDNLQGAIGKRLRMPVSSGDQITRKRFNADNSMGGFIGVIPKDMRAMTIGVDEVSGVAGFIRPAEFVDIVYTKSENQNSAPSGELLLQKVLVLAVGHTDITGDKGKKQESVRSITLAVDPRDAVRLRLAQQEGKITFLLRPANPSDDDVILHRVQGERKSSPSYDSGPVVVQPQSGDGPGIVVIRGTQVGR